MSASAWVNDLVAAVRTYARSRRRTPVVRVTLVSGEARYVLSAAPAGASDTLVVLNLYGDAPPDDLVEVESLEEGEPTTERVAREALVIDPRSVLKTELLYEYPGGGGGDVGFRAPASSD